MLDEPSRVLYAHADASCNVTEFDQGSSYAQTLVLDGLADAIIQICTE